MDGGSVRGNGGSVYDQAVSDAEESGAPVNYLKFVAAGWAATVGGSIAYSYRTKPGLLLSQRMIHARLFAQAATLGAIGTIGIAEAVIPQIKDAMRGPRRPATQVATEDGRTLDALLAGRDENPLEFDTHMSLEEEMARKRKMRYIVAGNAHWVGIKTMLPVLALSCCAMALVSKRVPNMPLLGVSGKVGITITPPLAVYAFVSQTTLDQTRLRYQSDGIVPPMPPAIIRFLYWEVSD